MALTSIFPPSSNFGIVLMTDEEIKQLLHPAAGSYAVFPHTVAQLQLIETHISWVILTGSYAYKIKKPVNMGFLDFSNLQQRKKYCEEELRLNRRTAPQLYLTVVEIRHYEGHLHIVTAQEKGTEKNEQGELVDYAVQMTQFDNNALLADVVKNTQLPKTAWQLLAKNMTEFHRNADVFIEGDFGSSEMIKSASDQNFEQIGPYLTQGAEIQSIREIETWVQKYEQHLKPLIEKRKLDGFIRDCHGDLHLGNLALIKEQVVAFDCIEFNESFRIIDTANEIAFTLMDLDAQSLSHEANVFLNAYLEQSGDYQALALLNFYKVYRAIVRAKVSLLSTAIENREDLPKTANYQQFQRYLQLAIDYTKEQTPFIAIMHGVSGSGKSYQAQQIAEAMGAIRLRSDVERKRLFGLAPEESSASAIKGGIYTAAASEKTFTRLSTLAKDIITNGFPCIVDATFLHQSRRDQFHQLAKDCNVEFVIIDCQPPEATILERLSKRQKLGNDASEADEKVMRSQSKNRQALTDSEQQYSIVTDTLNPLDIKVLQQRLKISDAIPH